MSLWQRSWQEYRARILWTTAFASALVAAVFLLHFQVAAFLLPLLAFTSILELWRAHRHRRIGRLILGTIAVGALSLVLVLPALLEALAVYTTAALNPPALSEEERAQAANTYYNYAWNVSYLVARTWLLVLTGASVIVGVMKRNKIVIFCLLWIMALYLIGNAYTLGLPIPSISNLGAVLVMLYLSIGLTIGAAAEESISLLKPKLGSRPRRLLIMLALGLIFAASHIRISDLEAYRFFVTPEDLQAMDWIEQNTPPDATFAVNTYFWLPLAPHGTDAGYWIPYLTGRQMTTGAMLLNLAEDEYHSSIVRLSQIVERLEADNAALSDLHALGIDYVYIGRRGDVAGPGLNAALLAQSERAELVYYDSGVYIFQILGP
jgi:hypothetical protein